MRKSNIEKLREAKRTKVEAQEMTMEDLILLLLDPRPRGQRAANPTQLAFINDPSPFKAFMGPKGSAKTSAGCGAAFLRSIFQPSSKGLIARNDYNDLKMTTRLRMEEMLSRLPKGTLLDRSKEPPETWYIQTVPVYDENGVLVDDSPSKITFAGLESLGEAGSYEFDWAFLDEASEIKDERTLTAVGGLLRNIPFWWERWGIMRYSVMLAFNPTDTFHWLYTACTGQDHSGRRIKDPYIKLFIPKFKENQRNLPADYYERMDNMPEDQRSRLRDGQWGATFEGEAVIPQYRDNLHSKRGLMERCDPYAPLIRTWDFGFRRPYCLWAQQDYRGRLLHLHELMGENVEIGTFIHQVKQTEKLKFPNHKSRERYDYGDPAARQKKDTGSTLTVLSQNQINLRFQVSTIEDGLRSIRSFLGRLIDGEPAMLYDAEGCPVLIRALKGGYHFPKDSAGQDHRMPVKDGYYDHPVDTHRYEVINHLGIVPSNEPSQIVQGLPQSLEYVAAQDTHARGYR